ncbi:hypothetical protein [Enterovibrio norvegicus]|uniref:hypothetical protein n=1 Tax=Enterovibrio norvegicus TaxID=188144 RepID=UPI00352E5BAB
MHNFNSAILKAHSILLNEKEVLDEDFSYFVETSGSKNDIQLYISGLEFSFEEIKQAHYVESDNVWVVGTHTLKLLADEDDDEILNSKTLAKVASNALSDGNIHALLAVYFNAANLQYHLHDLNGSNWASSRDIFFINSGLNCFKHCFGHSFEYTEFFEYANHATVEESHRNVLDNLYLKDCSKPLYLVVKSSPFEGPACDVTNLCHDISDFHPDLADIEIVSLEFFFGDDRFEQISLLKAHEFIGDNNSTLGVYRLS